MSKNQYFGYEYHVRPGSKLIGKSICRLMKELIEEDSNLTIVLGKFNEGVAKKVYENKDVLFIDHIHENKPTEDNRKKPHKKEKAKQHYYIKFISTNEAILNYILNNYK